MNAIYPGFHLWQQEQDRASSRNEEARIPLYVELEEVEAEQIPQAEEPSYGTVEISW